MSHGPSSQPPGHDRARTARLEPIEAAIRRLRLPRSRFRRLNGIVKALQVGIEYGVDSAEASNLLLDELRAAIRDQVGEEQGVAVLQAIDAFAQTETARWEEIRAGQRPERVLAPGERIDHLAYEGFVLLRTRQTAAACDRWLEAWEIVKGLARPELRTLEALDRACGRTHHPTSDWAIELSFELWNAGLDDPIYHEKRIGLAHEFLGLFPDTGAEAVVVLMRGEGESLWALGRRQEAEAVYAALVERLPDEGWGYIGWADEYYLSHFPERAKDYGQAEAILLRALKRPGLNDRSDVLDRLADLYRQWGQPEKAAAVREQRRQEGEGRLRLRRVVIPPQASSDAAQAPPPEGLGRRKPC